MMFNKISMIEVSNVQCLMVGVHLISSDMSRAHRCRFWLLTHRSSSPNLGRSFWGIPNASADVFSEDFGLAWTSWIPMVFTTRPPYPFLLIPPYHSSHCEPAVSMSICAGLGCHVTCQESQSWDARRQRSQSFLRSCCLHWNPRTIPFPMMRRSVPISPIFAQWVFSENLEDPNHKSLKSRTKSPFCGSIPLINGTNLVVVIPPAGVGNAQSSTFTISATSKGGTCVTGQEPCGSSQKFTKKP